VAAVAPIARAQSHHASRERRTRRKRRRSLQAPEDGIGKGSRVGRGTTASWRLGRRVAGVPASGRGRGSSGIYDEGVEEVLEPLEPLELLDESELPELPELLSPPEPPPSALPPEPDEPDEVDVDEPDERLSFL
jgi:hypothetical protein